MGELTTPVASEAPSLEELIALTNNPADRTLELAQGIQLYMAVNHIGQEEMGEKLGRSRPWISQLLGFLKLPPDVLEKAVREHAGYREYQQLATQFKSANNETNTANSANTPANSANTPANSANTPANSANTPANSANTPANRQIVSENNERSDANTSANTLDAINTGFPLIKETFNFFSRVFFAWAKDAKLSDLAEKWAIRLQTFGWLKFLIALIAISFIPVGAWTTVAWGRRWINQLVIGQIQSSIPPVSTAALQIPAPQIISNLGISSDRLELRWEPQAAGTIYRVYWHSIHGNDIEPLGDVSTAGAIVAIARSRNPGFVYVKAIAPNQEESPPSMRFRVEPGSQHALDSVEPLISQEHRPTGEAGHPERLPTRESASGSSIKNTPHRSSGGPTLGKAAASPIPPSPRPPVPLSLAPPVEVHAEVKTPDLIRLTWRPVGKDFRYNVYSSASSTLTLLRKENTQPLKSNVVDWTPETGLKRYWIVVTTLDAQDHESVYSEAIEVIRNPENSGESDTDKAAGILRKVLPW